MIENAKTETDGVKANHSTIEQQRRQLTVLATDSHGHCIRIDPVANSETKRFTITLDGDRLPMVYRDPCYAAADAGKIAYSKWSDMQEEGLITVSLEEPYVKELELLAYRKGLGLDEYAEKLIREAVESKISKREKKSLHKKLAV